MQENRRWAFHLKESTFFWRRENHSHFQVKHAVFSMEVAEKMGQKEPFLLGTGRFFKSFLSYHLDFWFCNLVGKYIIPSFKLHDKSYMRIAFPTAFQPNLGKTSLESISFNLSLLENHFMWFFWLLKNRFWHHELSSSSNKSWSSPIHSSLFRSSETDKWSLGPVS